MAIYRAVKPPRPHAQHNQNATVQKPTPRPLPLHGSGLSVGMGSLSPCRRIGIAVPSCYGCVSFRELQNNSLAQTQKPCQSLEAARHGEKHRKKTYNVPKVLAKSCEICYNVCRVPVIRLYRIALSNFYAGSLCCRTAACLFFIIILQKYGFVNRFCEKHSEIPERLYGYLRRIAFSFT